MFESPSPTDNAPVNHINTPNVTLIHLIDVKGIDAKIKVLANKACGVDGLTIFFNNRSIFFNPSTPRQLISTNVNNRLFPLTAASKMCFFWTTLSCEKGRLLVSLTLLV